MPAPLSDDLKQQILDRLAAGESGNAIAKDIGVSSSAVYGLKKGAKKRHARTAADSPPPIDDEAPSECADCASLYEQIGRLTVENARLRRIAAGQEA